MRPRRHTISSWLEDHRWDKGATDHRGRTVYGGPAFQARYGLADPSYRAPAWDANADGHLSYEEQEAIPGYTPTRPQPDRPRVELNRPTPVSFDVPAEASGPSLIPIALAAAVLFFLQ